MYSASASGLIHSLSTFPSVIWSATSEKTVLTGSAKLEMDEHDALPPDFHLRFATS